MEHNKRKRRRTETVPLQVPLPTLSAEQRFAQSTALFEPFTPLVTAVENKAFPTSQQTFKTPPLDPALLPCNEESDNPGEGSASRRSTDEVIEYSSDQRWPETGEPKCVVCGRYGAYICDETEKDVCSIQCKRIHLQDVAVGNEEEEEEEDIRDKSLSGSLVPYGEEEEEEEGEGHRQTNRPRARWNYLKDRWDLPPSELLTYYCHKCKLAGHMARDCTRVLGNTDVDEPVYNPKLRKMYQRCLALAKSASEAACSHCATRSNLARCLACDVSFCDGKGHLTNHLINEPHHAMLYSYKLKRQIKCSKPNCPEMNIYKLHACQHCLSKAFDRNYSLMNASWNKTGLLRIPTAICCDEHFEWHRINCPRTHQLEHVCSQEMLDTNGYSGQLSEFLF